MRSGIRCIPFATRDAILDTYRMLNVSEYVSLAPHTTFRIGGPAHFFARTHSILELQDALAFAAEKNISTLFLGGGSNVLISEKGWQGLVVKIEIAGIEFIQEGDKTILIAGAGEKWDAVVLRAVKEQLWGIENLSGIPGTVGAAPVQNIGAYGTEIADTFVWAETLDTLSGEVVRFDKAACEFGYRTSRFKKEAGRFVIVRAALSLSKQGKANLSYRDLHHTFAHTTTVSLAQVREAVLAIRSRKFPDLSEEGSAGSFFLNPVVPIEVAAELEELLPDMPQFPSGTGIKLSLAYLLDKGLHLHGLSVGSARLFERQPLVIVAEPGASAADVEELARMVQKKIRDAYGIIVEPEVRIIV